MAELAALAAGALQAVGGPAAAAQAVSTAAGVASSVARGASALQESKAAAQTAMQNAIYESRQLKEAAAGQIAAGQRAADEKRREAELAESRLRAVAARSGAGVNTATILKLFRDNAAQGSYRSRMKVAEGQEEARKLHNRAAARIVEAQNAAALAKHKGQTAFLGSILDNLGTVAKALAPKSPEQVPQGGGGGTSQQQLNVKQ